MIEQLSKAEIDERLELRQVRKGVLELLRENILLQEKLRVIEVQLKVANDALQIANARSHRGPYHQYQRETI